MQKYLTKQQFLQDKQLSCSTVSGKEKKRLLQTFAMFAAVLADFRRLLPTFRIELPVASIFLKRLSTPLLDHLLDGNSLNNLLELHFFLFKISFCIRVYGDFSKIYISQGSVTTQLRCGGIFNNHFTTNFLQNMRVKKNLKIG